MLVGIQMYPRMVFHTFSEEPLVWGLQWPNNRVLQGYHWLVFHLCLFCGETGHLIVVGGVLTGVLQYRVLEVWD